MSNIDIAQLEKIARTMYLVEGATNEEIALLIKMANRYGLSIVERQIVLIKVKRGDRFCCIPYVTRDGYLIVAERSGKLESISSSCIYKGDEFTQDVAGFKHSRKFISDEIVGAYSVVKRVGVDRYFVSIVDYSEAKKAAKSVMSWEKYGADMICKKSDRMSLKKAFPDLIEEELDSIDEKAEAYLALDISSVEEFLSVDGLLSQYEIEQFHKCRTQNELDRFRVWLIKERQIEERLVLGNGSENN